MRLIFDIIKFPFVIAFYCMKYAIIVLFNFFKLIFTPIINLLKSNSKTPKVKKEHKNSVLTKPLSDKELNLVFITLSIILIALAVYSIIANIKMLKYIIIFAVILALTFFSTRLKSDETTDDIVGENIPAPQDNNNLSTSNETEKDSLNQDTPYVESNIDNSSKVKTPSDYELFELASKMNNQYEHDEEMQAYNQNNDISNDKEVSQQEEREIINQVINELKEERSK